VNYGIGDADGEKVYDKIRGGVLGSCHPNITSRHVDEGSKINAFEKARYLEHIRIEG